ncbi:unnamed protein product [Diamesa serratosioi]
MLKLTVVICVVFCLQKVLTAPYNITEEVNTNISPNVTMIIDEIFENLNDTLLMDEPEPNITLPKVQADTQGCIEQNLQTEVVNFMRDISNFHVQVFDDVTSDVISKRNQLVDRLNSEKVFFLATINACVSAGISIDVCIQTAVTDEKPKISILIGEQVERNKINNDKSQHWWTSNVFDLINIYSNFLNVLQNQKANCP